MADEKSKTGFESFFEGLAKGYNLDPDKDKERIERLSGIKAVKEGLAKGAPEATANAERKARMDNMKKFLAEADAVRKSQTQLVDNPNIPTGPSFDEPSSAGIPTGPAFDEPSETPESSAQTDSAPQETNLQKLVSDFEKNYPTVRGSVRPLEGETADDYEKRLRKRSADRRDIEAERERVAPFASGEMASQGSSAIPQGSSAIPQGKPFTETSTPTPPASPQVKQAAATTAEKSYSPIYDKNERLAARQQFAKEIGALGSYDRLNEDQRKRATAMGLDERDISRFYSRSRSRRGI